MKIDLLERYPQESSREYIYRRMKSNIKFEHYFKKTR